VPEVRKLIAGGFARGLRARWLPGQEWEALLALPLSDVRRLLRVGPPPAYTPYRSHEYQADRAASLSVA
jgi:ubiquinone biosynthesis protein Coq4